MIKRMFLGALFALFTATMAFAAALVNLNTADAQALATLNGIGDSRAQAIVAYRDANGPFKSVEDLVKVKGIGEKLLAKLKPMLTVE
ncbi:MAG: ComEA family DNA-binding protein [Gammaproteobacteria bacterium]